MTSIAVAAKRLMELQRVSDNLAACEKGSMTAEFSQQTEALALSYISGKHRDAALKSIRDGLQDTLSRAKNEMIGALK